MRGDGRDGDEDDDREVADDERAATDGCPAAERRRDAKAPPALSGWRRSDAAELDGLAGVSIRALGLRDDARRCEELRGHLGPSAEPRSMVLQRCSACRTSSC